MDLSSISIPAETIRPFLVTIPVDVTAMLAALGLEHRTGDLAPTCPMTIEPNEDGSWRITTNQNLEPSTLRFAQAHAIAHYVLHRDLVEQNFSAGLMHAESKSFRGPLPESLEIQAGRYTASLLMPAEAVRTAYEAGHRTPAKLAALCGVSSAVADLRMTDMKLPIRSGRR